MLILTFILLVNNINIIIFYENRKLGEDRALCTSEFSDISPLTGGNVAFATLDGRPGAYNFDHNQELQHWVSATDIR